MIKPAYGINHYKCELSKLITPLAITFPQINDLRYTPATPFELKRSSPMIKHLYIFIFLMFTSLLSATVNAEELTFFDESFGDFSEELALAKEEGKLGVFIFFSMDECPWCHRMKTTILNQPEVLSFYKKHFKIYQIDIEGDVEMTDFQGKVTTQKDFSFKQHRVRATPVLAFFDLDGKRAVRYTGATSSIDEFLMLGDFVVSSAYKKTSFTRYKRNKRKVASNSKQ